MTNGTEAGLGRTSNTIDRRLANSIWVSFVFVFGSVVAKLSNCEVEYLVPSLDHQEDSERWKKYVLSPGPR